jgi:chromosome segregation ATPase
MQHAAELKLCQSLLEEVETKLESCTANVAKGNKDIGDWRDQAANAQEQLALIKDKLKILEKDHAEAKKEIASLTRTISQARASYKVADSEAALLRERAAEAEDALEQCQREQSTAILPKWMEEYVQGTLVQAWYSAQKTVSQIKTVAIKTWNRQIFPLLKQLIKVSSGFAASAFSTGYENISKVLNSTLPENALVAVSNIKTKLIDAWSSEIAITIRQTLYASLKRLLKESDNIITELEGLLQQFVADVPVLSPLARKPFSRVAIVVLLGKIVLIISISIYIHIRLCVL